MPSQKFVVKFNDQTDLYMVHYDPDYSRCEWGTLNNAQLMEWGTLAAAEAVATSINHSTIGLPKPR